MPKKTAKRKSTVRKKRTRKKAARTGKPRGPETVLLDGRLDVRNIRELRMQLVDVLESDLPVTLDMRGCDSADTATLQLLVAFLNTARARSAAVTCEPIPGEILRQARLVDLHEPLESGLKPESEASPKPGAALCPVF